MVERLLRPVLPCANLSAAQRATASATRVHALGGALGIIVGCVFGVSVALLRGPDAVSPRRLRLLPTVFFLRG